MLKLLKYKKIAREIYKIRPRYASLTDQELKEQTVILQRELKQGKRLEDILPEAFAVVIEADKRVLGLEPYYVQILGGIALFFGNIAELKTGEGKTLVATMPMYLKALAGKKGNFLITENEYLAERDGQEMGQVYRWLGLKVGVGVGDEEDEDAIEIKKALYDSDIIYTTHSKLGFDYLFDNLGTELSAQVVTRFNFAIIDEIDGILLDGAQTALVISGAPKVQSNYLEISDWFVKSLSKEDYEFGDDNKTIWFTSTGQQKIESYFDIKHVYDEEYIDLYRHLVLSLQANYLKKEGQDYVIQEDKVVLLDVLNGRAMRGVKLQGGIHQAIEAKEGLEITNESKVLGTISYQSLFKKFKQLAGMTGTAKTDEKEFIDTYQLEVVVIPPNIPVKRVDQKDAVYVTNETKIEASLKSVQEARGKQRPVLIETGSVTMSNLYSLILLQHKIPHNILNATTVAREKKIIAEAGTTKSVTLATAMVGRGTDIKLTTAAKANGGLKVIGTERMGSKRIDNQLRGRSGRQGEPGESFFLTSLEDKLIVENAPQKIQKQRQALKKRISKGKMPASRMLSNGKYAKLMDKVQKKIEETNVKARKNTMAFDLIVNGQREKIYEARKKVMGQEKIYLSDVISESVERVVGIFLTQHNQPTKHEVANFVFNNVQSSYKLKEIESYFKNEINRVTVDKFLKKISNQLLGESLARFKSQQQLMYFKKIIILKAIDDAWVDHLDYLQRLKDVINGRSSALHKPINEFEREARRHFFEMEDQIWLGVYRNVLLSEIEPSIDGSINVNFP